MRSFWFLILALVSALAGPANAHDPSAWGGLFRSRDFGANWFPVDAGLFIGGALGVAVHPRDPAQLLYGTDARLLRSKNGGRDWTTEQGAGMSEAVYAVLFDAEGRGALAASGTKIFRAEEGGVWQDIRAPGAALPVRAFVRSHANPDRIYLAGERGLFASIDNGRSWMRSGEGVLPENAVAGFLIAPGAVETLYAIIDGNLWTSTDDARNWSTRTGLPAGRLDAVTADLRNPKRLWATAAAQVYLSEDAGLSWAKYGAPLTEPETQVRGIAVSDDGKIIVLATHRGLLRSVDAGKNWVQVESTLPVHLETGLLLRDPHDPATLYAGFSLTPYAEMRRRAGQSAALLAQLDPISLAGGAAFLALLGVGGIVFARWLIRRSRAPGIPVQ
jgi:photosystem II stability/assembly factor-like uncharacterized protein